MSAPPLLIPAAPNGVRSASRVVSLIGGALAILVILCGACAWIFHAAGDSRWVGQVAYAQDGHEAGALHDKTCERLGSIEKSVAVIQSSLDAQTVELRRLIDRITERESQPLQPARRGRRGTP